LEKTIGLFRAIQPEWLVKTAELIIQGNSEKEIKDKLEEFLSFEIESPINRGKSRALLMNIWANPEYTSPAVHEKAIKAFQNERSDKIALSWALFVLAHPLFADVSTLIGRISTAQDTFTTGWIKEKVTEHHGERPTLLRAVAGVLETMRCLGVIENVKSGTYRIKRYILKDEQTIAVILLSLLAQEQKAYYEISELSSIPQFFPYKFSVTMEWLHHSPDFMLENVGNKTVLTGMKV